MSTNWDGEFKKLYEEVSDSWLMLPLAVRGIGCEVLRVSNRVSGKVGDTRDTRALIRKLGGEPSDAPLVEAAVTALLEQGFLMQDERGALFVTNLAESQREQRAKWAEKKRNQRAAASTAVPSSPPTVPDCPPVSPVVPETVPLSPREGEGEEREKRSTPLPPRGTGGAVGVGQEPHKLTTAFAATDEDWGAISPAGLPPACQSVLVRWFVRHHLDGESRTAAEWRRSFRHWATKAWNTRRSECLAESRAASEPVAAAPTSPLDADALIAYQESL